MLGEKKMKRRIISILITISMFVSQFGMCVTAKNTLEYDSKVDSLISLYEAYDNVTMETKDNNGTKIKRSEYGMIAVEYSQSGWGILSGISSGFKPAFQADKWIDFLKNPFNFHDDYIDDLDEESKDAAIVLLSMTINGSQTEFLNEFSEPEIVKNVIKGLDAYKTFKMSESTKDIISYKKTGTTKVLDKIGEMYPQLVKNGQIDKLKKLYGESDSLSFLKSTEDVANFLNELYVAMIIYNTNTDFIKEYRDRTDSQVLKDYLNSFISISNDSFFTYFSDKYLNEKLKDLGINEFIKLFESNQYVKYWKKFLKGAELIRYFVFEQFLDVASYESVMTYSFLTSAYWQFVDSFFDEKRLEKLKKDKSVDDVILFCQDYYVLLCIGEELLNSGKTMAKRNKVYGTNYVNGAIAVCQAGKERILKDKEYFENYSSLLKDNLNSNLDQNSNVPGSMTVSASKSNYTTNDNVVLNWTSSLNATEYGLTVKRVEDGKTIFNSRLNGSSKNLGCLEAGTYTYVMRGHNANGKGPLTPVKQFTVEASNKNNIPEGNGDGYLYKSLDKDTSKPDFPGKWIRTSASTSGTVIGSIPYGEMAVGTKFSSDGKWVYVNYKNVEGWVMLTNDIFPYQGIYTCPIVTFNANGGSVTISNKKVFINTPYGTLPTPVRNGYIFDGWYTSSNGGTKIISSTNVTLAANQTLYAHWVKDKEDEEETAKLTITFDPMGGKVSPTSKKGEFNTPYGSLPTPTRNGYVFLGWYTVKGGGGNEVTSTHYVMKNYDHTLYAHWDVSDDQTCIITYNANGGIEPPSPQTVNEGERVTISNEKLSRSGYEFLGWAKKASSNKADYTPRQKVTINENITLYAVWKAKDESFVLTIGDTKANVFGQIKYNDVAPIIENNRTMLPARFIAENLGADVEWIDKTRCVLITREDTEIEIFIGNEYAKVNGKKYKLDSPAFIRENRTYTPVRFICENLGADVEWNSKERSVKITLVKCSVCGSTNHTEHIASDGWEESLPSFVKNNQDDYIIEKRTEYLYETRETRESDKEYISGWDLYDTDVDESSWSKWQETPVYKSSTREVRTKTQYGYYHYALYFNNVDFGTYPVDLAFYNNTELSDASREEYHEVWLDSELKENGKVTYYNKVTKERVTKMGYKNTHCSPTKMNNLYYLGERTVYQYKDTSYTYYHEKWTEGEWTSKKKSENSNCRLIDTRTVYKYESR